MEHIKVGIIGMGRIGRLHLKNLSTKFHGVEVGAVMNPSQRGRDYAARYGVPNLSDNVDAMLDDPSIDVVLICSPSASHADYIIRAAERGKIIFCEKPIDMSLDRAKEVVAKIKEENAQMMVAFNRRFDPDFAKVQQAVSRGEIGTPLSLHIISRDPGPPSIDYLKESGGLFRDMAIHDFDMAQFIMGSKVNEVFATGGCLIDPEIGKIGDIDSSMVMLRFENGATAVIEDSRKAVYGYDQRLEIFGTEGMLQIRNPYKTNVYRAYEKGTRSDVNLNFFMDRYEVSYMKEMEDFIDAIRHQRPLPIDGDQGIEAMVIAEAAYESLKANRPVKVEKFR
ncbi:inositol 2-dehydrogenase [Pareuzebyella sediminis]|uniref:inositol 2-dehydrogenase n=1 Tax=Pareuzebyella sediminis TaxID=2607998 RepID=UPI0011EDDF8B|nr:inositol 2-dehydrogenase [Pareuzebyella sediminis]